ncbi:MAG: CHAD domain-containing protein [Thermoleophilia bacterium]|nr:CHAD domain-containing protein [Thermoleophilia bacterium]
MPSTSEPEPGSTPDERFRLAAALVLEDRVDQVVGLSRGLLDVTNTDSAEPMWLACRRMRAAIEMFSPCFSKAQSRGARQEVRSLTKAVGNRRDIDSVIGTVEGVAAEMDGPEGEGITRLTDRLRRQQADANRALAQVVHGRRMQAFRVRIEDLTDAPVSNSENASLRGPHHPLQDIPESATDLVVTRLARLRKNVPAALEPYAIVEPHQMRVAAERLRYSLELTAEALGSQAHGARRSARALQAVLGEMRDCDLALPEVREQIRLLEEEDVKTILERASGSRDLDPVLVHGAPNRAAYRGLELLVVHLQTRRQMMFERFRRLWLEQSRQGVWVSLEASIK